MTIKKKLEKKVTPEVATTPPEKITEENKPKAPVVKDEIVMSSEDLRRKKNLHRIIASMQPHHILEHNITNKALLIQIEAVKSEVNKKLPEDFYNVIFRPF